MKKIKFRQAMFLDGKFHHWHYWGLIDGVFVGVDTGLCSPTEAIKNSQMFTNLPDKNGKEICEGDIVRTNFDHLPPMSVEYYAPIWMLKANNAEYDDFLSNYSGFNLEVIGNIYENPKLLSKR